GERVFARAVRDADPTGAIAERDRASVRIAVDRFDAGDRTGAKKVQHRSPIEWRSIRESQREGRPRPRRGGDVVGGATETARRQSVALVERIVESAQTREPARVRDPRNG